MNMDVTRLARGLSTRLIGMVYPPRCVLCGSSGFNGMDICVACYRDLPWIESACTQCAIPLAINGADAIKCGHCLKKSPAFDHSISLFSYQNDAIKLIHQLKFNEKLTNARLLGSMLAAAIQKNSTALPNCVVPVPLYKKRLRQRGYNQSIELARPIHQALHIPISVGSVIRVRDTPSQTGLDKKQRHKNILNAFQLTQPLNAQHVAILDDVVTTSSTVNELARILKKAGVRRVDIWSIARAI